MPDDPEELPSLHEVRQRLRDLHFSEDDREHPAGDELIRENTEGVIERGFAALRDVRSAGEGWVLAEDRERIKRGNRHRLAGGKFDRLPPLEHAAKAERDQRFQAWGVQHFEQSSGSDDLRRIHEIHLTTELWVKILEREEPAA